MKEKEAHNVTSRYLQKEKRNNSTYPLMYFFYVGEEEKSYGRKNNDTFGSPKRARRKEKTGLGDWEKWDLLVRGHWVYLQKRVVKHLLQKAREQWWWRRRRTDLIFHPKQNPTNLNCSKKIQPTTGLHMSSIELLKVNLV